MFPGFTTSTAALVIPLTMELCVIRTSTSCFRSGHGRRLTNIGRVDKYRLRGTGDIFVKYRAGYAAQEMRHAFLPAVVSTSGRIHGDLFRLLYILAHKKTSRYVEVLGEAVDVDSEAYCWKLGCSPLSTVCLLVLSACACSPGVTVTSSSPSLLLCRLAVFSFKPTIPLVSAQKP